MPTGDRGDVEASRRPRGTHMAPQLRLDSYSLWGPLARWSLGMVSHYQRPPDHFGRDSQEPRGPERAD